MITNKITPKNLAFAAISIIWLYSAFRIIAPSLGVGIPVFPRPSPDYTLYTMIGSAAILVVSSLITAIKYFKETD